MIENDLNKTILRSIYDSFYYHTTSPTLDKLTLFALAMVLVLGLVLSNPIIPAMLIALFIAVFAVVCVVAFVYYHYRSAKFFLSQKESFLLKQNAIIDYYLEHGDNQELAEIIQEARFMMKQDKDLDENIRFQLNDSALESLFLGDEPVDQAITDWEKREPPENLNKEDYTREYIKSMYLKYSNAQLESIKKDITYFRNEYGASKRVIRAIQHLAATGHSAERVYNQLQQDFNMNDNTQDNESTPLLGSETYTQLLSVLKQCSIGDLDSIEASSLPEAFRTGFDEFREKLDVIKAFKLLDETSHVDTSYEAGNLFQADTSKYKTIFALLLGESVSDGEEKSINEERLDTLKDALARCSDNTLNGIQKNHLPEGFREGFDQFRTKYKEACPEQKSTDSFNPD